MLLAILASFAVNTHTLVCGYGYTRAYSNIGRAKGSKVSSSCASMLVL